MRDSTNSLPGPIKFCGVPTEELQLELSWLRQTARDIVEDPAVAVSTKQQSLDYINYRAAPIAAELARRKEQLGRFAGGSLADPWPDAGVHKALVNTARRLKQEVPLSSYIATTFPYSGLRQTGRATWTGRCIFPDHDDTTPSLVVYDDNRFTCFGCDRHGDIFQAIAVAEGLERFADQVRALARWAGNGDQP